MNLHIHLTTFPNKLAVVLLLSLTVAVAACQKPSTTQGGSRSGTQSVQGDENRQTGGTQARGGSVADEALLAAQRGNAVYINARCGVCHRIGDEGGQMGPELTRVGARLTRDQMKEYIRNPKAVNPNAAMPPQELSDADLEDLVQYLSLLR